MSTNTDIRVSVHIIAKETTNLGNFFIKSCLQSLVGYADEIVLVDNGCSEKSRLTISEFRLRFPRWTQIFEPKNLSFAELRNKCLENTSCDMTFFHWIDTDEIWFPELLMSLKYFLNDTQDSKIFTNLVHLMIDPFHFQDVYPKNNIFRIPKDRSSIKWSKNVHELIEIGGSSVSVPFGYLHFGYCREQWRICLRWLYYALLEFGNANCYCQYNEGGKVVDYFKDWRTPDSILEDRKSIIKPYIGEFPQFAKEWLDIYKQSKLSWSEWIKSIDDQSFWEQWLNLYKKYGNWKDTLGDIIKIMEWTEKLELGK